MPTLEIATVPLKAGSDVGDPNNPAAAIMKETVETLGQQEGMQRLQFGIGHENPSLMQMFIDWDSKQKHLDFMAKDVYGPFRDRLVPILDGGIEISHQDMQPEGGVRASLGAPVTEVATFYFDGAPPSDAFESAKKFIETCQKELDVKIHGWAYGITQEEIEKDGVKGKGAVLTIGWDSVEDHMKVRETKVFKDNAHLLRQGCKSIEMHHVRFLPFAG